MSYRARDKLKQIEGAASVYFATEMCNSPVFVLPTISSVVLFESCKYFSRAVTSLPKKGGLKHFPGFSSHLSAPF